MHAAGSNGELSRLGDSDGRALPKTGTDTASTFNATIHEEDEEAVAPEEEGKRCGPLGLCAGTSTSICVNGRADANVCSLR